ncbi:MAG TPA: 3-oxoacyl-[acyl-carrier-protein] synthase III C-terminal domain-containing protein [Pseudonocardiaceae bacterium]|nr:3-oxoacyl-[acyl-carrier-protein] synthase III C-terminal domain-containing protein [Pseudonocardiaceae bacterium]
MTALLAVATHVPETVPLAALAAELGLSDQQVRRFGKLYGLDRICRSDASEAELLIAAAGKLAELAGQEDRVRYVVRARTVPAAAPYPLRPLGQVRRELRLDHATTFAVTDHACASGLLAVDLVGTMLAADGDPAALALVLVGEKVFTPDVGWIPDVGVLGEGTAAVLVGAHGESDEMLGFASRSYGLPSGEFVMSAETAAWFRSIYADGLTAVIGGAVDAAGVELSDVDLVLPHNVNRISWTRSAKQLGIDPRKLFLDNVPRYGHCFCADPFINYRTAADLGLLRSGQFYLMVSVGLGSTFSAMLLRH